MLKLRFCFTFFILLFFMSAAMYGQIKIKEKVEVKENTALLKPPPNDDPPAPSAAASSITMPFYGLVTLYVNTGNWNPPLVDVFYTIGEKSGKLGDEPPLSCGSGGGIAGYHVIYVMANAGETISVQMYGCCNMSTVNLGPTIEASTPFTDNVQNYLLKVPVCGRPGLYTIYGGIQIKKRTPPPTPCWEGAPICDASGLVPTMFIPKAYRNQPSFDLTADVCSGVVLADGSVKIGGFMKLATSPWAAEPITNVDYCYDKLSDRWRFKVNGGVFEPRVVIDICESVIQNKGYVLLNSPADLDLLQFPCDALKDIEGHANYPITSKKYVIKDLLWAHEENHSMVYRRLFESYRPELTKLMAKVEKSCEEISHAEIQKGSFAGDVKYAYAKYLDFIYNEHEKLKVVQNPDGTLSEDPNFEINNHSSPYVQVKKQKYIDYLKIKHNCR